MMAHKTFPNLVMELTVSAPGLVFCAAEDGGEYEWGGTSFGEPLKCRYHQFLMASDATI